jgi:CheY-like chemotaxis protein/HPt (histidine-containing phosphotransfer) domain-containing protein
VLLSSLTNRLASVGDDPFDRAIAKPIKRDALLRVLAELLGGAPPQTLSTDESSKDFAGRHILLVDDNTVNQKLGVRQLNLLGVTVAQAWNGAEAMEKLRLHAFDAVLMDCQMPEMDGYEATRLLRCKDSGVLNPEVPVIAMTANALAGDREQCLAAGMNDYITKPIDRRRLREILLAAFARVPSTAPAARSESNQEIFDILGLREIVGNDPAFIDELLATFLESAGGLMNQIEQCADQDPALLKRLAHQLRGASANILARRLAATATSVELGDASHKAERLVQLRQDWSESQRQIAELLKKTA